MRRAAWVAAGLCLCSAGVRGGVIRLHPGDGGCPDLPTVRSETDLVFSEQLRAEVAAKTVEWERLKERYAQAGRQSLSPSSDEIADIKNWGRFRERYIGAMLCRAAAEVEGCEECAAEAFGSTNPTSDYDVTIAGTGNGPVLVTKKFNELFVEKWGQESAVVFDTNICE